MCSVQIALRNKFRLCNFNSYHVSGVVLNESDRSGYLVMCAEIIIKCVVKEWAGMPWN